MRGQHLPRLRSALSTSPSSSLVTQIVHLGAPYQCAPVHTISNSVAGLGAALPPLSSPGGRQPLDPALPHAPPRGWPGHGSVAALPPSLPGHASPRDVCAVIAPRLQ